MSTRKVLIVAGCVLWLLLIIPIVLPYVRSKDWVDPAKKDLLIYNTHWDTNDYGGTSEPVNRHDFTIRNRSKKTAYSRIDINIYYLDKRGVTIDSESYHQISTVKPGDSIRVEGAEEGRANPKTASARLAVRSARTE